MNNITYRKTVGQVEKGDIIVHYVKPFIRAISRATDGGSYRHTLPDLGKSSYGSGWSFRTDYFDLRDPIHRDRIVPGLMPPLYKHYPINSIGHPRQGYFFPFDVNGLCRVLSLIDESLPSWLANFQIRSENPPGLILPEEIDNAEESPEGSRRQVTVNAYERNAEARKLCIDHFGAVCIVCDLDFESEFTDVARGLIHVHHKKQLSEIGARYHVDPIRDLVPVCPNCHAVMHLRTPPVHRRGGASVSRLCLELQEPSVESQRLTGGGVGGRGGHRFG
jgi:hypothetical protein